MKTAIPKIGNKNIVKKKGEEKLKEKRIRSKLS